MIEIHAYLVRIDTKFGADGPRYSKEFDMEPGDKAVLNLRHNTQKLRYIILGYQLWNILLPAFKVGLIGSKNKFQRVQEYGVPLPMDFICRHINPTPIFRASKLKDKIGITKTCSV